MAENTERAEDATPDTQGDQDPAESSTTPVTAPRRQEREIARLAERIAAFAAAHGGSAEGQIAYLGACGYRLVLIAKDGAWGDQVAMDRASLTAAAERAGVNLAEELDGALAARMRTGPYEWRRMAGSQLSGGTP